MNNRTSLLTLLYADVVVMEDPISHAALVLSKIERSICDLTIRAVNTIKSDKLCLVS